jgi:hypothetical protein
VKNGIEATDRARRKLNVVTRHLTIEPLPHTPTGCVRGGPRAMAKANNSHAVTRQVTGQMSADEAFRASDQRTIHHRSVLRGSCAGGTSDRIHRLRSINNVHAAI